MYVEEGEKKSHLRSETQVRLQIIVSRACCGVVSHFVTYYQLCQKRQEFCCNFTW